MPIDTNTSRDHDRVVFLRLPQGYTMRPHSKDDAAVTERWINDPEVRPYLNRTTVQYYEEQQEWLGNLPKRKENHVVLVIVDPEGQAIGSMGLHNINWKDRTATTGAMFGSEQHRNKGVGGWAKMMLLDHAFNVLDLRQIYSEVISFNLRSIAYSKKCGYEIIAKIPEDFAHRGAFYDRVIMRVTRASWQPLFDEFCAKHGIESFTEMLVRHGNTSRS